MKTVEEIREQIEKANTALIEGYKNYEELQYEDAVIFLKWVLGEDDDEPIEYC